jgi:hypothetical protein
MRRTACTAAFLALLVACGRPHARTVEPPAKELHLLLGALGPLATHAYPGDAVALKVVAMRSAGTQIDNAADVAAASGEAVAWRALGTPAADVSLSSLATLTDPSGIAQIVVQVGTRPGLLQVQAVASGADPIAFSVDVEDDQRELVILGPSALTSIINRQEEVRVRMTRPASQGLSGPPIAGANIPVRLLGGAQNGAGLDAAGADTTTITTNLSGIAGALFATGSVADFTYQLEFCGQGRCPGTPAQIVTVLVRDHVAAGGECTYFTDCEDGFVCVGGACMVAAAYCNAVSDCPTGYACNDTSRICEISEGSICGSTQDCPTDRICGSANRCIPKGGCLSNADCPAGWTCDAGSGACRPPADTAALDVRGKWIATYHFDLSKTLDPAINDTLRPAVDFLNLLFANQLKVDAPLVGLILQTVIGALINEFVPPWIPRLTKALGDFIHVFDGMDATGEMTLLQSPTTPRLGTVVSGDEVWKTAQLYVESLCKDGPAAFAANPACGRLDVVLKPTTTLAYSNNSPTVGVKVKSFGGEVMADTLMLRGRSVEIEARQLINVALDVMASVASGGEYWDFREFLGAAIPCGDLQGAVDDLACNISGGNVCELNGFEAICEVAAQIAALALDTTIQSVPVSLKIDFQARALIHDDAPHDGRADMLGAPQNPSSKTESSLAGGTQAAVVFGGDLDERSWWYAKPRR